MKTRKDVKTILEDGLNLEMEVPKEVQNIRVALLFIADMFKELGNQIQDLEKRVQETENWVKEIQEIEKGVKENGEPSQTRHPLWGLKKRTGQ